MRTNKSVRLLLHRNWWKQLLHAAEGGWGCMGALPKTIQQTIHKQTNKQTNKQASKQASKQTNKQTNKQANKQTNKQQIHRRAAPSRVASRRVASRVSCVEARRQSWPSPPPASAAPRLRAGVVAARALAAHRGLSSQHSPCNRAGVVLQEPGPRLQAAATAGRDHHERRSAGARKKSSTLGKPVELPEHPANNNSSIQQK